MTELELLKRKILLKKQSIKLFIEEIEDLNERLQLLKMRQRLERQMKKDFDPVLSRKLDCLNYLIEK